MVAKGSAPMDERGCMAAVEQDCALAKFEGRGGWYSTETPVSVTESWEYGRGGEGGQDRLIR
jgi:hypothetical protein